MTWTSEAGGGWAARLPAPGGRGSQSNNSPMRRKEGKKGQEGASSLASLNGCGCLCDSICERPPFTGSLGLTARFAGPASRPR